VNTRAGRPHAIGPILSLPAEPLRPANIGEFEDGECYPEALVEPFILAYTEPGATVFDPFTGSGTTLIAAERLGRVGVGLEIHPERVDWCAAQLRDPSAVRVGDARALDRLDLPPADLIMTSPPYMTRLGHPENPLTGYQTTDGDYQTYLRELTDILTNAARLLTDTGRLVVNVANLTLDEHFTPLAWDLGQALSRRLQIEREIVIDWDVPPTWISVDYCLVFSRNRKDHS